ncbi:hypothetical protein HNQ91_000619 [Filimonas zeae]|uniref:Uncharacterized protein n=1 Tax=Filimonas zeae TaxID=1737353 RepID=A0A917INT5_9BACT|nr:DUF4397 domain-containing protein [Filimonas zeae]MDR6337597.1 hypothetical protein [Filimonas zeae]GGH59381.1 hypothetical protein GCM10011379_06090 [Filimonas zeae]
MRNIFICAILLVFFVAVLPSCKKGDLITGKTNGALQVESLALPNTPIMDIYFKGVLLDSVFPGGTAGISPMMIVTAGDTGTVAFTRHDTKEVLLDTVVSIPANQKLAFRIACSEELGIRGFMGEASTVHGDSCKVRFFNQVTSLQPAGVEVDLCLFRFNAATGDYDEFYTFPAFARGQMTEAELTLPVVDKAGELLQYIARLRDRATGAFLEDEFPMKEISLSFYGGAYVICIINQRVLRNKNRFNSSSILL